MSVRIALNHAALTINPPPRTSRESREILRSLKKFGQVDLYRSFRHETSTLEAKGDAVVLFRDQTALKEAIAASPINISVPPPPPSPIPLSGNDPIYASTDMLPNQHFNVEVSKSEYNHETKIINQLFIYLQAPLSLNQESPPGTSLHLNTKIEASKLHDIKDSKNNIARSTHGGWKDWRTEMKSAGISKWEAIKARFDGVALPSEPHPSLVRQSSIGWGRSQEPPQIEKTPVIPPSNSKAGAISNPSPLPLDPTLQPSTRRNQISRDWKPSTGRSFLQSDGRITTSGMLKNQNSDNKVTRFTATSQRGTSRLDLQVSNSVHRPDILQEPYSSATSHHNPNTEYKDASTSAAQEQSLLDTLDNSTLILPDSNLPDSGPASSIAGTGYASHQNHCSGDKVSKRELKTEKSGSPTDGVSSGLADSPQMEESSVTNAVPKITYNLAGGATISNTSHKSAADRTELDITSPSEPQLPEKPWWKVW